MKVVQLIILFAGLILFSCDKVVDTPADIVLDELTDMTEYTEGFLVDCEFLDGQKTTQLRINGKNHPDGTNLDLRVAGYYRIEVFSADTQEENPIVIRIVILDSERGLADWGLPPWTPRGEATSSLLDQSIKLVHPSKIPASVGFPAIVLVGGELMASNNSFTAQWGSKSFNVKRGVGSTLSKVDVEENQVIILDNKVLLMEIEFFKSDPLTLSGILNADTEIPAYSYVHIPEDLTIPSGITLTIREGSFITIDPEVNIYNEGGFRSTGTSELPVTLTCSKPDEYWGGFISTQAGNIIEASNTIFCQSGHHSEEGYNYGHAKRQALFFCKDGTISLDHCYMTDHIGQIFYPVSATVNLNYCLVQRAKTGGQINSSQLTLNNSIFTDFPDDTNLYQDEDNDGLYLMSSNATISHSAFMYIKDDGIDSGGSGGGEVDITYCYFQSIFHEGAALSSKNDVQKMHRFIGCTFIDCGQGLELGYSSSNHQVFVDDCMFYGNGIGIRYGDPYLSPHKGYITVTNSQIRNNSVADVWNMKRETWSADTSHMVFNNVWVTTPNPMYPQLKTIGQK